MISTAKSVTKTLTTMNKSHDLSALSKEHPESFVAKQQTLNTSLSLLFKCLFKDACLHTIL